MVAWITDAHAQGLPEQRACAILAITPRSLQRWRQPPVLELAHAPRPRPVTALTPAEAAAVVSIIRSPQHADQSSRELALSLMHGNPAISVSHVTVWRYQGLLACNGPRGRQRHVPGHGKPDTAWVTGPNQLWAWDVTWLTTAERGVYLFLYSLLDHFSRKTVAWQVRDSFTSDQAQHLWDQGLVNEGILTRPTAQWPKSLSDRGSQMRSHSTKTYFRKLGILQLFSRPRQPNDNPRIEAHFGTVKTMPAYPGFFVDELAARLYFASFYAWYNNVHPLTTLAMLTPMQWHTGQASDLLAARRADQETAQRQRRLASHLPFTVEDLIDQSLPDVSHLPVFSWGGPNASVKKATPLA